LGFNGDLYPSIASSVLSTKGDIVRYNTERERYGIGSTNQILQVKSALPSWETVDLADTVLTTAGDVLFENSTPELARLPKGSDADVLTLASGLPSWVIPTTSFVLACSDEDTAITDTGTVLTFYMPFDYTVVSVRASLVTTSSSGTPTIDISQGGTSIMTTTKITIDAGDLISTESATQPVLTTTALTDESKITIDIDVTGTDATGLKCYIIGYRV